jgi:Tfp pilus assembly protein PilF
MLLVDAALPADGLRKRKRPRKLGVHRVAATTGNAGQMRASQDMTTGNNSNPPSRRLDTWKEIATYFGRDERTVRRWEASRGLPVYRVPGSAGGTVYAFEAELAAWLRGHPENIETGNKVITDPDLERSQATFRVTWLAAAMVVGAIVALGLYWFSPQREPGPAASSAASHDPQATALYKAGLYEWQTRTPVGLTHAADDFQKAIARDPDYAQAYAGLANCYNLLREYTTMPPQIAYPRAKAAAERAIALDPDIGEAHAALAFDDFYWSRDIRGARREFLSALALEPRNAAVHHWYATFLMTIREFPQALSEIEKAEALDSASTAILADKGLMLFYSGKSGDAIALLARLEQTEPNFFSPHQYLAAIYLSQGDDHDYLRELDAAAAARRNESAKTIADAGTSGLASGGRNTMFNAMLGVQKPLFAAGKISAYELALGYANANDDSGAIKYLNMSLSRHETDNVALAIEPSLQRLRAKPEFRPLLLLAGLASHA